MSDPPSEQRSKRQRVDKHGRFAALERLRNLKGSKHKYEVDDMKNVYDLVDEKEYVETVNSRVDDDWIEDEEGTSGYKDDGREIFDDDELEPAASSKCKKGNSKKRPRDEEGPVKGKKSLKNYFKAGKEQSKVKLEDDDILSDLLGEIGSTSQKPKVEIAPKKMVEVKPKKILQKTVSVKENSEEEVQKYMENFSKNIKKTVKTAKDDSDEEILDRVLKQNSYDNMKSLKNKKISEPAREKIREDPLLKMPESPPPTMEPEKSDDHDLSAIQEEFLNDDFEIIDEPAPAEAPKKVEKVLKDEVQLQKEKEIEMNLLGGWESICQMELENDFDDVATENATSIDSSEMTKIWYWDAWSDPNKTPGELYIFGKIASDVKKGEFKSVCVHVENVDKCMYLLPRDYVLDTTTNTSTEQKVSMLDVYNEFCEITNKLNISKYKTRKVTKNYAHVRDVGQLDIPDVCDYLEVRYSAKLASPSQEKPFRTIAHIFGTNSNVIENFLLDRKLKGPSWLEIKNFTKKQNGNTWCKVQLNIPDINCITVSNETTPPPPLVVCTLNVRSALNEKTNRNEIVMISALVNNRFFVNKPAPNPPFNKHFCIVTRMQNKGWPFDFNANNYKKTTLTKCDSERHLLNWFLSEYIQIDPDLVVTHDSYNYQLDLICNRLISLKIPMWSRIGRLKINTPSYSKKTDDFFIGRMVCDIKLSAEELIKSRSYDLNTLCMEILKINEGERKDVQLDDIPEMYEKTENLFQLIALTMQDAFYIMRLMCDLNVIPLALQITQIAGNLMNRTLHGGRAERNEYLMLHAFSEKDYILPDKLIRVPNENLEGKKTKSKAAYAGGLVLDPIKGFYDKYVLLMDFNSLYPSIIQEYNICFTTVLPPKGDDENPILVQTDEIGILPRQIRKLVDSRRAVKQMMKKPGLEADLKMQYNIRQLALKLTANSLYGCLGFSQSRFFAKHLASLITLKGREILMNTKSIVEKMNYQVIYGDTDSIMINTNITDYDQVWKIGNNIKQLVNKTYKCLELDIDGVYKYLLLLKKKKYAAVTVSKVDDQFKCTQELKGLDIVRRDWSKVSVMAGNMVLKELLTDDRPMDERIDNIHTLLEKLRDNLNNGTIGLQLLEITKQLTKNLKEYSEKNLPHVLVAQRMNKERNRNFKKNDMVNYIICKDGTTEAAMKRAYHIDEIRDEKNKGKLEIDIEYYLSQQIHPVVFRLCEPIEGTDAHRIAVCLGIDPKKYQSRAPRQYAEGEYGEGECMVKTNLQKYRHCHKFYFTCVKCHTKNTVAAGFKRENGKLISIFQHCENEKCQTLPQQYYPAIRNQLILAIRADIKRYYEHWMICDNPNCNINTREYSQVTVKNNPHCLKCKNGLLVPQYSESDLHTQLSYYRYMFDIQKYDSKANTVTTEIKSMYSSLKETVEQFLQRSKYATVIFSSFYINYMVNPDSQKQKIYPLRDIISEDQAKIKGKFNWSDYNCYE